MFVVMWAYITFCKALLAYARRFIKSSKTYYYCYLTNIQKCSFCLGCLSSGHSLPSTIQSLTGIIHCLLHNVIGSVSLFISIFCGDETFQMNYELLVLISDSSYPLFSVAPVPSQSFISSFHFLLFLPPLHSASPSSISLSSDWLLSMWPKNLNLRVLFLSNSLSFFKPTLFITFRFCFVCCPWQFEDLSVSTSFQRDSSFSVSSLFSIQILQP